MITKHPHHVRSHSTSAPSSSSSPSAPTRKRTHLKPNQLTILQNSFTVNPLPDAGVRSQLAHDLGVSERTIQIWFQNRRAKARKLESLSNSLSAAAVATAAAASSSSNSSHPHHPHTNNPAALAAMAHHVQQQQQQQNPSSQDSILLPRWMEQATRSHHQPRYQPTFRTMMTPERFEELKQQPTQTRRHHGNRPRSSSKPEKVVLVEDDEDETNEGLHGTNPPTIEIRAMSEGIQLKQQHSSLSEQGSLQQPVQLQQQQTSIPLLNIRTLRIGTWSRFACQQPTSTTSWDLKCFVDPTNKQMTWQVLAEGHLFRIQIPMEGISQIRLVQEGQLEIELDSPQQNCCFAMFNHAHQEWIRCGDFSEDKQASHEKIHVLLGNHDALQQALLDLAALAPELTAKMVLTPLPLMVDDIASSCSPSVTPEPFLNFSPLYSTTATNSVSAAGMTTSANSLQVPPATLTHHTTNHYDKSLWASAYGAAAADPTSTLYQMSPYGF